MFQNAEELTATHSWPPYNCGSHKMPTVSSRWDILSPRRLKFKHYHQESATPPNSNEKKKIKIKTNDARESTIYQLLSISHI